ncbi:uncharacterized protein BO96DRAFT_439457 [Aspergillus niger CBS 101883]|uniref:Uncharacterized protein n=1 Tax=Aspergillus niger ATCC 13496 TaxID=1353008 RepID=A0A370BIV8_ASPNG|nr:uncharacterized protein BO96DRAFT_439457 [Aspergillus niger CBS 101883]PYH50936.1 hypothetical protein BO96DRAFT_439457 [Aspergillus niger CBS 101883]RDH14035.1 hypothetical protein M747DRAFT_319865 [Aspergillus niger ATCC 13496]
MVAKNRKKEKKARTGTIQAAQGSGIPISCDDVATDAVPKPAAAEEPEAFLPAFSQDAGYLEPLPGNVVRSYEPSAAEESEVFVPASGEDARYLGPMSEVAVQLPEPEVAGDSEALLPTYNNITSILYHAPS